MNIAGSIPEIIDSICGTVLIITEFNFNLFFLS